MCVCVYLQALQYQLKQAQKLGDMYREQVIQLEDKLARIREEGEVGKDLFKVGAHSLRSSVIFHMFFT